MSKIQELQKRIEALEAEIAALKLQAQTHVHHHYPQPQVYPNQQPYIAPQLPYIIYGGVCEATPLTTYYGWTR